jgi:hypothetical protein
MYAFNTRKKADLAVTSEINKGKNQNIRVANQRGRKCGFAIFLSADR